MKMTGEQPLLRMEGISKRYGGVVALDRAELAVGAGRIHAVLGENGFTPERLDATAHVTLEPVDGKPTVSKSHLVLTARIPGIDAAKFEELSHAAKAGCPISRLLNTEITLDATLEN